jgi:hypothetical protein
VVIALQYKTDRMQTRPNIQFNRGAMRERSYPQKKQNSAHKMVSIQTKSTKRTQNKLHSLVLEDTKKQKIHKYIATNVRGYQKENMYIHKQQLNIIIIPIDSKLHLLSQT